MFRTALTRAARAVAAPRLTSMTSTMTPAMSTTTRAFALDPIVWPTEELALINSRGGGPCVHNFEFVEYDDQAEIQKQLKIRWHNGVRLGELEGEEVVFPHMSTTIEWVISSPPPLHGFHEIPVVKETLHE